MFFADLFFLYFFLPLCFLVYFVARGTRQRNVVLIIFSLLFYAAGEPVKILILLGSAAINYFLARLIASSRGRSLCKASLVISLVFNIGMLAVIKYTDFFIENINGLFGLSVPLQNIALPLGISFYTFTIISYMIDVFWEKVEVQKDFSKLLLYISMFPQIVAGPIVRYSTVASDLSERRTSLSDVTYGFTRLIVGLSKKVLLANNLSLLADACFGQDLAAASVSATWLGVIAYSMQVYFDFSGYSDMAIGIARIFGFHLEENFKYPFMCRTISEFWQRWHISLGSFFRDYLLYLPVFGKRRAVLSLFLVWFTTGLWHGASWNFVIWGLYFGVFVFIESKLGKKRLKKIPSFVLQIYNKLVIIIGFGIFRFENMGDLGNFFKNLVGQNGNELLGNDATDALCKYLFVFVIAFAACFPIVRTLKSYYDASSPNVQAVASVCVTVFVIVLLFADTSVMVATRSSNTPFLYARF